MPISLFCLKRWLLLAYISLNLHPLFNRVVDINFREILELLNGEPMDPWIDRGEALLSLTAKPVGIETLGPAGTELLGPGI